MCIPILRRLLFRKPKTLITPSVQGFVARTVEGAATDEEKILKLYNRFAGVQYISPDVDLPPPRWVIPEEVIEIIEAKKLSVVKPKLYCSDTACAFLACCQAVGLQDKVRCLVSQLQFILGRRGHCWIMVLWYDDQWHHLEPARGEPVEKLIDAFDRMPDQWVVEGFVEYLYPKESGIGGIYDNVNDIPQLMR